MPEGTVFNKLADGLPAAREELQWTSRIPTAPMRRMKTKAWWTCEMYIAEYITSGS
jgi:hypothetical protein